MIGCGKKGWFAACLVMWCGWAESQAGGSRAKFDAFEVATVKRTQLDQTGRFIKMENPHRFVERAYTLKLLIAAAYDLNAKTISGGPAWVDSERYDIVAVTPGEVQPNHDEQMAMLRALLAERFQLRFHREGKEFAVYALEVAKGGPKLKLTATPERPTTIGPGIVYPQRVVLPARNAGMSDLASLLQRAIVDRPVVDRTGLTGRYDFDLEWAPDDSQFGGDVPAAQGSAASPPLFTAMQQELGLRLEAARLTIAALVVESAERPVED